MPQLNNSKSVAIKLFFKDPRTISVKSDPDTLDVVVKESTTVKISSNQIIKLSANKKASSRIPP
jgi:hypothetical protein